MNKVIFVLACIIGVITIGLSFDVHAQESSIPNWIKNTAKFWVNGDVGDKEFENGIQYLVENKIIKVSNIQQYSQTVKGVPSWIKNLAGMWSQSKVSDDDFTKAIEYMVNFGIIPYNLQSTHTNNQNQITMSTKSSNDVPTLIGAGTKLNIINNKASGFLTVNGEPYSASNLTITIKPNMIAITGNVQGHVNGLLMITGIPTTGIEYDFNGVIANAGNSVPVNFTAFLTNPTTQSVTTASPPQNIPSSIPPQAPGLPMMMLTSENNLAYMLFPYQITVKIFDPQSNPQKIFDQYYGGIPDANITITFIESNNNILIQSTGKTDSKGIYQVGFTMPNTQYSQQPVNIIINATKNGYTSQQTVLPITLIRYHS